MCCSPNRVEKGLYCPCSENSDCEADLCLCFRISKLLVLSCEGSIYLFIYLFIVHSKNKIQIKTWIIRITSRTDYKNNKQKKKKKKKKKKKVFSVKRAINLP